MKVPDIEIEDVIQHRVHEPEFYLWLHVTIVAFQTLQRGWGLTEMAKAWIFDLDNEFFNLMCHELDIEAEAMRKRIEKALKRAQR